MKTTIYAFAIAASITVISCKDEKKQDTVVTTTADTSIAVKDVAARSANEGTKKTPPALLWSASPSFTL